MLGISLVKVLLA